MFVRTFDLFMSGASSLADEMSRMAQNIYSAWERAELRSKEHIVLNDLNKIMSEKNWKTKPHKPV